MILVEERQKFIGKVAATDCNRRLCLEVYWIPDNGPRFPAYTSRDHVRTIVSIGFDAVIWAAANRNEFQFRQFLMCPFVSICSTYFGFGYGNAYQRKSVSHCLKSIKDGRFLALRLLTRRTDDLIASKHPAFRKCQHKVKGKVRFFRRRVSDVFQYLCFQLAQYDVEPPVRGERCQMSYACLASQFVCHSNPTFVHCRMITHTQSKCGLKQFGCSHGRSPSTQAYRNRGVPLNFVLFPRDRRGQALTKKFRISSRFNER